MEIQYECIFVCMKFFDRVSLAFRMFIILTLSPNQATWYFVFLVLQLARVMLLFCRAHISVIDYFVLFCVVYVFLSFMGCKQVARRSQGTQITGIIIAVVRSDQAMKPIKIHRPFSKRSRNTFCTLSIARTKVEMELGKCIWKCGDNGRQTYRSHRV